VSALYGGIFFFVIRQQVTQRATMNAAAVRAAQRQAAFQYSVTSSPSSHIVNEYAAASAVTPIVDERGMDIAARQTIIGILAERRPLSDARRRQLHALLAKAGQDMFPSSGGGISPAMVRQSITDSGQLPSASDSNPNAGPDYFVIATGKIEVADDRAHFQPSDHSEETILVSAAPPANSPNAAAITNPAVVPISNQNVHAAIHTIDQQTANRLTSQQRQSLIAELSLTGGLLAPTTSRIQVTAQSITSTILGDGSVMVFTSEGQVRISPVGIVTSRTLYHPSPTSPPTLNFNTTPFGGPSHVSRPAVILVVAEAAASILLSIYLLVIGILTLRQSPSGRRLHIIYGVLKIPLAIACGVGWCWIVGGLFSSIPNNGGNMPIQVVRLVLLLFATGAAVIYPIALFIAFSTPTVHRYYASASA
jgi:hypothetical protein